jgi:SEC-C motif-containing protein
LTALDKHATASAPSPAKGPCPCGRPQPFDRCCGRYLADFAGTPAPDAESLMRSRYTAFVLSNRDYLLATWHPDKRPGELELDPGTRWLGLEVRKHRVIDASRAEVEFVARFRATGSSAGSGRAGRVHERSRFVKENGRWFYLDGEML